METVAVLALLVLLVAAVAPGLYALRRRMGGKIEFWRLLQRRGLSAAEALEEPRAFAMALQRCSVCPSVEQCRQWLASNEREGFDAFCPNARYVHALERR